MINKEDFKAVLEKYPLSSVGHARKKYVKEIVSVLDRKEILILKGIRRSGKTTIIKQIIKYLKKIVPAKQILYVNLDDYNFLPHLSIKLLNFILEQLPKNKKCYLFLDEIQKIPGFESWLRTQYDREVKIKFIVSGSNSSILTKDLATLLTGRNLTFEIFPLDYNEFKYFSRGKMGEFLTYGGFPEIVLEKNEENKLKLLRGYISDIINKDILYKNEIRGQKQFLYFTQFIFNNPGVRLSINKLSKELSISKDSVKQYLQYMIDAYLIFEVPFFSYSAKTKFIASNISKYYPLDNGFYLINSSRSEIGKQYEAIAAQKLFRENKELFYWKDKNEVDFVCGNIAYNIVSSSKIPKRELQGLEEIKMKFRNLNKFILVNPNKNKEDIIQFKSLEKFSIEIR